MDHEPPAASRDPRDGLIARDEERLATAALARLPDREREAVVLYYRSELSIAEVAIALGLSEDAARQRVHRGRTRLRDLVATVETALRATRPGPTFTAGCVAAWALGRGPSASAAARPAPAVWLQAAIFAGVIGGSVAVGLASGPAPAGGRAPIPIRMAPARGAAATAVTDPRAALRRRFRPMMPPRRARSAALPAGALAVDTDPTPDPSDLTGMTGAETPISLDFVQAPVPALIRLLATAMNTPIWVASELPENVDIRTQDEAAIDVLDDILARARAVRTEVAALRLLPGGPTDASSFGGAPVTASFRATPLDQILDVLEPALAMPIGRLGNEPHVDEAGHAIPDQSPVVTLELHDTPAGLALEQALIQTGYGYELTTGFVITADPAE